MKALVVVMGIQACSPFPLPRGVGPSRPPASEGRRGHLMKLHLPTDCHYANPAPSAAGGRTQEGGGEGSPPGSRVWEGGPILCEGTLPVFQAPVTMYLPSASSSAPLGAGW